MTRHCTTSAVAGVLVLRGLSRIGALHRVAAVRPDRVGDVAERRHPEVVAGERDGAVVELLVVRVRRHVRDARRCPSRWRRRSVDFAAKTSRDGTVVPVGAVADRPRDAVAPVEPAVPPDARAGCRRPRRCPGTPGARSPGCRSRLGGRVTAGRRRRSGRSTSRPGRPLPAPIVWYVEPVAALGAGLRRVVDDVHPLVRRVELVGGRANLRVAPEEREAGRAVRR